MEINNITLNFLDKYYMFYEWLNTDDIKVYQNIPVFRVKSKIVNDFINNLICVNNPKFSNKIIIFTDGLTYLAINFDNIGNSKLKSSLLFEDEEKIGKKINKLQVTNIDYIVKDKEKKESTLRIDKYVKSALNKEINNLFLSSSIDKIKYIYYEWFKKEENNLDIIKKKMYQRLSKNNLNEEKRIYEIFTSINK